MKSFVTFLSSNIYDNDTFKCIVSNLGNEDIIMAHKEIFIPECTFEIRSRLPVYNEDLFLQFIHKLPQYKSAFVTVSFFDSVQYTSCKMPKMIYTNEQEKHIIDIITLVNQLCSIVQYEYNDEENDQLISSTNTNTTNTSTVIGISNYDDFYTKIPNNCIATTDLYYTTSIDHHFEDQIKKYTIFNKGYVFNFLVFKKLFPELSIQQFTFPNKKLAESMLLYQINLQHTLPLNTIVHNINTFFFTATTNTTTTTTTTTDDITPLSSIKISDLGEDIDDTNQYSNEYDLIKKFIDNECIFIQDAIIQSSILFLHFKEYCTRNNISNITHTKFSKIVKQVSIFDTIRKTNGIYWINLQLKE